MACPYREEFSLARRDDIGDGNVNNNNSNNDNNPGTEVGEG